MMVTPSLFRAGVGSIASFNSIRHLHVNPCLCDLQKLTRVRCVDNSAIGKQAMAEGKPPKIIHVYNKRARASIGEPGQI